MKANKYISRMKGNKWLRKAVLAIVATALFSYLYTRGVSPVWAAWSFDA